MRWRKNEGGSSHGAVAGLCATPMLMCGRRGATRADVCSVQCAGRPAAVCAGNASSSVWCGCTEPHGSPSQRQPGSLARVPTSDEAALARSCSLSDTINPDGFRTPGCVFDHSCLLVLHFY